MVNIRKRWKLIVSYTGWEDFLGFAILVIGVSGIFDYPLFGFQLPYNTGWTDFYKRIWPELISIGIAVLIIDNANEAIKRRKEKNGVY